MEVVFLVLVAGVSLAVAVMIAVFVVLIIRAIVKGQSGPGPAELGRAIGLVPHGRNDAYADREGIRVHARWTSVQRGAGKSRRTVRVMRYSATFDPPLRMGLEVGREGLLDGFFDAIGVSGDIQTGDAELDRALRIGALDAQHAAVVLRDPDVKRALLAGATYGVFGVTDAQVACGHDRWVTATADLQRSTDLVFVIARALRAARGRTQAAWEPQLAESWGAIARTDGAQWMPERSRLASRVGDAWATLDVLAEKGKLVTRLVLRFDTPLGIGLDVSRTGMGAQLGALLGAQDVECGHTVFDAAFTVKAKEAAVAKQILADGGADAVMRIVSVMPEVHVDDAGAEARIGSVLADPRLAGQVMRAATDLAKALRGSGARPENAYR